MNNTEFGFVFHVDNCIQCHGCETACKMTNNVELGIKFRNVINIWQGEYPNIKSRSISISCLHCVDPKCVEICPSGAIIKNNDGIVIVNREECIGCKACFDVCPFGILQFNSEGIMEKCNMCQQDDLNITPACIASCPTKALEIKRLTIAEKLEIEEIIKKELENI